jgi:hypothetical protein
VTAARGARGLRHGAAVTCAIAAAACRPRAPIATCDDNLRGVYVAERNRWMVLDEGATLEAYPLFPDVVRDEPATAGEGDGRPGGVLAPTAAARALEVAPRVIDLTRRSGRTSAAPPASEPSRSGDGAPDPGPGLAGTVHRRYLAGVASCEARVPVHVSRCADDSLDLVLADPSPPLGFTPCTWPRPAQSRRVRWHRE